MVFLIKADIGDEYHRMNLLTYMWTGWQPTRGKAVSAPLDQQHAQYSKTTAEYLKSKFSHNQTVYLETDTDYIHLPSME